jgi:hypothetical protein
MTAPTDWMCGKSKPNHVSDPFTVSIAGSDETTGTSPFKGTPQVDVVFILGDGCLDKIVVWANERRLLVSTFSLRP